MSYFHFVHGHEVFAFGCDSHSHSIPTFLPCLGRSWSGLIPSLLLLYHTSSTNSSLQIGYNTSSTLDFSPLSCYTASKGGDFVGTSRTRANRKYNDLAYDRVAIRVHKGTRSRWHDEATRRGLSLAGLIVTAVTEYIETHPPDDLSPASLPPAETMKR